MSLGSTSGWFVWRAEDSIDLSRLLLSASSEIVCTDLSFALV